MRYATQPEDTVQPRLLDVNGVAKLYGISPRSVWRLCKLDLIPAAVHFGQRATRWRMEDLLEHISELQPSSPVQPTKAN